MINRYENEDDCVATIEETPSGVVVRWVGPEEGSCLIAGFPNGSAAHHFVMFADFKERTFKSEAPFDWKDALRWEYLPG